ncbi:hypothetical protein Clacol_006181 [Clathrus columnatus]|uniref:BTB domain-containing protein n=1 Tax=Clathrus columnatus TaxID=1419009 RepID=A0AAV5AEK5_9AGAM|nr:hypothetical protein Clacol_006181 [Clathrus columnatus]
MSYTHPNGNSSTVNGSKSHLVYGLSSPIESASSALGEQSDNHHHQGGGGGPSTLLVHSHSTHPPENGYHRTEYTSQPSHNEEIIDHLYHAGFQMGNYADTILNVHGRQYRLHAILLSRSPYLAHLMSTFSANTPIRNIYVSIESEPEVTEEGFAIALGYLYSSVSLELITPSNARAVLAAACFLGGLPDLCSYAYETCRDSISTETIEHWLRFVENIPPPPSEDGSSPSDIPTSVFGPYAAQLRADVLHFLITTLPHTLQAFPSTQNPQQQQQQQQPQPQQCVSNGGKSDGLETLLQIYTRVPFDMFKQAVESPDLPIGPDQARFQFAKSAVARRKATVGNRIEETVVLAFGGSSNSTSAVHVTRKVKKRPLVSRDQREVAIFDWTAGTHLGLLTIAGQRQIHMGQLVRQQINNVREFTSSVDGVKFEWRRTPAQDYELFAPSDCRIASYSQIACQTKWGTCHGLLRYTFKNRDSLLLEALLALCLNRWIDMNCSF